MKARYLCLLSLCLLPSLASAHPGHNEVVGFIAGASHPWFGLDHFLAMLAVGMWAAQLRGNLRWQVPLCFVGMMLLGAILGFGGIHLGAVEQVIATSVVVLGLLLASAKQLPTLACIVLTGCFAMFHGYAHAMEFISSNALLYMAGMTVSTAVLHAIGLGFAIMLSQYQHAVRWTGVAIASSGMAMMFS